MPGTCSRSGVRTASRAAAILPLLALAVGCGTLSVQEEQALGRQMAGEIRRGIVLLPDRVVERYVREIGEEILRAAGPQPFEYRFYVSELAGVIAHEIGHVQRRHIAQNYNRQRNMGIGYQAAVLAAAIFGGGAAATAAQLGGGLAATAYLNSFGREAELEADTFAVETMPRAGYDPNGLVTFFETLRIESGDRPADFLSSHPATADRAAAAHAQIAAQPPAEGLRVHDNGRLEIIQRRIEIVMGDRRQRRY